ncbi:MAG TPA: sigma-54-dependent Fis family transcriptional regulator [Clostridiales bacterium]|nr:sigma-54-dependent Fis family transcriptional regulator [Clostridiales bacterium]
MPIEVNVRIISASHKNLEEMVKRNEFREDLYYRLNVIPLHLPLLKERGDDILLCSQYIIKKLCYKMNKPEKYISKEVEEKFMSYDWPGNVRELENVLEYAINFTDDDEIGLNDLPEYFLKNIEKANKTNEIINVDAIDIESITSLEELTKEYEKNILKKLVDIYGDTIEGKRKVAQKLNISVTTLYRKLNDYQ